MLYMLISHNVYKLNFAFSILKTATCIYRGAARASKLNRNGPESYVLITRALLTIPRPEAVIKRLFSSRRDFLSIY
jgi:hypothetical protein